MDLPEAVKKFESILKCQSEKTLNLYDNQKQNYNCHLKPKEVITNLRHQLYNLQKADVTNRGGQHNRTINLKKKNTEFISVNMLGDATEVSPNQPTTSKFETQFDTELISLVEGAELQLAHGMTQEFTTAFIKTEQNDATDAERSTIDLNNDTLKINFKNINDISTHTCDATTISIKESEVSSDIDRNEETIDNITLENIDVSMVTNCSKLKEFNDTDINNDVDIKLSPVLQCSKSRTKVKSNLVYNLESFEKFESIAVPIVDENKDNRTATKIINSQMVDKVLFLNLHTQPTLIERDKQCSPVITLADEEIVIYKDACGKTSPDKRSDSLEDELLFSSDEENDYIHDLTPELPIGQDTSSDETEDLDKSIYVGFQTASNRSIQVFSDSFQKAKSLLNDLDAVDIISNNNNSIETINNSEICKIKDKSARKRKSESLEIADNKKMKISEDTIQNIEVKYENSNIITKTEEDSLSKIIDDDLIQEFDNVLMSQNDNKDKQDNTTNKKGEQENETKSDTLITLDNNIADTKVLRHPLSNSNSDITDINIPTFCGFKTASNKEVKVSNTALTKSKAIFQDLDLTGDIHNITEESKPTMKQFVGFQTASNKNVKISAEALEKSKKIFENIDDVSIPYKQVSDETPTFKGFKTASDKEIIISQQALKKYENILTDIDVYNVDDKEVTNNNSTEGSNVNLNKNEGVSNANQKSVFEGFRTASNKEVKVSEISLAKSRKLFNELNTSHTDNISNLSAEKQQHEYTIEDMKTNKSIVSENIFCKDFAGFKTASNKDVQISRDALAKSKKLFQDLDCGNSDFVKSVSKPPETEKFQGFQTASNKKVTVSEKALQKTKSIFQDIDVIDCGNSDFVKTVNKPPETEKFQGFQTASNKKVTVSEKALQKTKSIFQDIDFSVQTIDPKYETKSAFKGFQTASNKNVLVSKEAIEKSKKLFDDLNTLESNQDFDIASYQKPIKNIIKSDHDKAKTIDDNDYYIKPSGDKQLHEIINPKKDKGSRNISFKHTNTRTARILSEALKPHKDLEANKGIENSNNENINNIILPNKISEVENILDTQVINNFDETLCSEDFIKTPRCKRSGSPILSCPSTKRRKKFETPYRSNAKNIPKVEPIIKTETLLNFDPKYKKTKQYKIKDLLELEKKSTEKYKNTDFKAYDFDNLLQFNFDGDRNDIDHNTLTVNDIITKFEDTVDKKIIPKGWTQNHIKLILWKLISYEIKFPTVMKRICTAKNVIGQLKFRFNKELYSSSRPALRKIMEKDEIPSRTMVLCVVAVYVDNIKVNSVKTITNNIELLLTDGWYSIMATIDKMLMELVVHDKIKVGTKLAVCGAELVNCEQGVAPWENTSAIRLKIFGNSTRRARWDARLGFHGNGAILSQLSTVKPDGGKVAKLRVYVTRVYPMLYVEKFEDGSTVTRSERLEHLHQIKYENERQALMEKIYEEVEKELADQTTSQESESASNDKMESGSQIARVMKKCNDPADLKNHLTSSQLRHLLDHTSKRRDQHLEKIQARFAEKIAGEEVKRQVTSVMKMRVVGVGKVEGGNALLTIWRPNESIIEVVREGKWIEIANAVPTSIRYSELQLSAGRQSIFRELKLNQTDAINNFTNKLKRQCYHIKDLIHNYNNDLHEIDTLGMVFLIEPSIKQFDSTKQSFQNVYLTNEDKNFVCINFWGGIKKFGYENLLNIGDIVVCVNLQKRAGNTRKNIPQFRATEFTYFTKTPKDSVAKGMVDIMEKKLLGVDRCKFSEDCELMKNNSNISKTYINTDNISPYRFNNSDYNISKNKVFIDSPLTKTNKIDDNLNLTGLDFDSTFRQTNTQDLSPNTLARKRKVQEKIDKLKRYGEPPPISPISIINQSKNAANAFKSPLPNLNVSNVANEKEKQSIDSSITTNIDPPSSPVIAISKNYVKKKINPVKLNFSNNVAINDNIDQFEDDFESSPPLSLD